MAKIITTTQREIRVVETEYGLSSMINNFPEHRFLRVTEIRSDTQGNDVKRDCSLCIKYINYIFDEPNI